MKKLALAQELKENAYPGRGIVIGRSKDGKKAVTAYFIMGRSENSRNRVFVEDGEGIRTQAFDPSKLSDPSLIIYAPVRVLGNDTIVTRAGNDIVDGGDGLDTLDYSEIDNISNVGIDANLNTGIVTYKIDTNSKIDPDTTFTDTIANIENIIATQDKDIIVGNAQNNTLKGMAGADTISGGAGEDSIEGGDGNDTISGNAGNDILKGEGGNDYQGYLLPQGRRTGTQREYFRAFHCGKFSGAQPYFLFL